MKTIKGYINAVKRIEENTVMELKGYNKLSEEQKESLGFLSAGISNDLNDFLTKRDMNQPKSINGGDK